MGVDKSVMIYVLVILLAALVALFVWLISIDTKEKDRKDAENSKKAAEQKNEKRAADVVKRECFESYRLQQINDRSYSLFKSALSDKGALSYIQEFLAFRRETEDHRLMSYEYRNQLAERVLDPLKKAVSAYCPYENGEYTVPQTFDIFLTPEEYYDQQMSYRGNSAIYQTDIEFWQERLELSKKKIEKNAKDPVNAFWADLWRKLKPLLEEMDNKYRADINEAASREAALLYTKDMAERIEEALYRSGLSVHWYINSTPGERSRFFKTDSSLPEHPAIVREADEIVYERGNYPKKF